MALFHDYDYPPTTALEVPLEEVVVDYDAPLWDATVCSVLQVPLESNLAAFIMTTDQLVAHVENRREQAARRLERDDGSATVYPVTPPRPPGKGRVRGPDGKFIKGQ